jgi:glycosyltransferase involved in cell wall biosynthesis
LIPVLWVTHVYPRWDDDPLGGFLHRLGRELPEFGFSLSVLAPASPGSPAEEIKDGVSILRFPHSAPGIAYTGEMHRAAARNPAALLLFLQAYQRAMRNALRRIDPSIVHAHWWFPSGWIASRGISRSKARRFVVSVHGTDVRLLARFPLALPIARRVFRRADRALPVSAFLDSWLDHLGVGEGPRTVLPMPADATRFSIDANTPRGGNLVVAARLVRQKRVDLAIRGFAHARRQGADVSLQIVGDGPERSALEALARELKCAESIFFHGVQPPDRVAQWFRSALAVVLSSEEEGYGLVLVEAALCGTPAIGVRSGAIPEVVIEGETGWLREPGDWKGIGEAMVSAIRQPATTLQMGMRARERAQSATARPLAQSLARIYSELGDVSAVRTKR